MFNLSTDLLAAAAIFASKEETRYYLNGVFVQPCDEGVRLVATDGYRLAVILDREGTADREAIIKFNPTDKQLKTVRKDLDSRRMTFELPEKPHTGFGAKIGFGAEDGMQIGVVMIEEIDGTFPDYRRVIPRKINEAPNYFGVNGAYVADCAKAADRCRLAVKKDPTGIIEIIQTGDSAPMIVRSCFDDAIFVVMPARPDTKKQVIPDWVPAIEVNEAA